MNWSYRSTFRHDAVDEYDMDASSSEATFDTWMGLADDNDRPE